MMTFSPMPDIDLCPKYLDNKRLGKQRVEAKQILDILRNNGTSSWRNHPIVLMWKGFDNCLAFYYNCCLEEWKRRKFKNTMPVFEIMFPIIYPKWFSDKRITISHRGNLLRKNYDFYKKFEWDIDPEIPYYWPFGLKGKNNWNEEWDKYCSKL